MNKHKTNEKIQRLGCGSLFSFSDDYDLANDMVYKYHAYKPIIDAMLEFQNEHRIQPYGSSSLHQLIKVEGAIPLLIEYGMDEDFIQNAIRVRGDWPYEINGTNCTIAEFGNIVLPEIAQYNNFQKDVQRGLMKLYKVIPKTPDAAKAKLEVIAKDIEHFEVLQKAEKSTGVKKVHLFCGAIAANIFLVIVCSFNTLLGVLLSRFSCFAYPAFATFRAIEAGNKYEDTQWMTYWFIFGAFALLEESILKQMENIPFIYFWIKCLICLWCWLPQTRGSKLLYRELKTAASPFIN